jgi:hypothetical protein
MWPESEERPHLVAQRLFHLHLARAYDGESDCQQKEQAPGLCMSGLGLQQTSARAMAEWKSNRVYAVLNLSSRSRQIPGLLRIIAGDSGTHHPIFSLTQFADVDAALKEGAVANTDALCSYMPG